MARSSLSNLPRNQPLKWTVAIAAREFGLASMTLRKLLAKSGAVADKDGLYTTRQLTTAIYDSMSIEKLLTQRELRKKLELENSITTSSVLNRAALSTAFFAIADAMTHRIMASSLTRHEKEDSLLDLSSIQPTIANVASSQSRLPRAGNGDTAHNVDDDAI